MHTRRALHLIYRSAKLKPFQGLPSLMQCGVIYWTLSELKRSENQVRKSQVLQKLVWAPGAQLARGDASWAVLLQRLEGEKLLCAFPR